MPYMLQPQPVPADVLAALLRVADDVLRASRRLPARLKRQLGRVLALPLALLAFATGAQAAEPTLTDALECRLQASKAESVLARYGVTVDGPAAQLDATAYGIRAAQLEATHEAGALHLYYVIPADAAQRFIDAAGMEPIGPAFVRLLLDDRNGLQAMSPAAIRQHGGPAAPILCEMRA
ncbi:hypothetical protein [Escherichia coli]|uniref:hypothetical protein n=1 Tax=Escherichia coli TaxID=562 RepID=UPI0029C55C7D|nr:hypothetical protein [Escherichia coli]MDX5555964.1 hypothetical protein [Escherichia coli]